MSDWERVEPGAELLTGELLRATLQAAFETEIRPVLSRIMREHYERTGKVDYPDRIEWQGHHAEACAWLLTMESGARHRIPFALLPSTPPH